MWVLKVYSQASATPTTIYVQNAVIFQINPVPLPTVLSPSPPLRLQVYLFWEFHRNGIRQSAAPGSGFFNVAWCFQGSSMQ